MIDYEEELKKFEPCLDVADAEGARTDGYPGYSSGSSPRSQEWQTGKIRRYT